MKSEAQFKQITCPHCGSSQWIMRHVTKYTLRIYCAACNRWNREATTWDSPKCAKRIDKQNQPSHCGKCKYFSETVFETETQNGWASWYGDCICDEAPYAQRISRYIGCEFGMLKPKEHSPCELQNKESDICEPNTNKIQ